MDNLSWVLRRMFKVRGALAVAVLLLTVTVLASLVIFGIQKYIIDDIFLHKHANLFVAYMAIFACSIVVFYASSTLAYLKLYKTQLALVALLVEEVMGVLYRMDADVYKNERIGRLVDHVTGDVQEVAKAVTNVFANGVRYVINAAILMVVVGRSSWPLLALVTGLSVLYVFIGRRYGRRLRMASGEAKDKRSALLVRMEEGVASTREVIAFHRERWERKRLQEVFGGYFAAMMREAKVENSKMFASDPIKWGITLLMLGIGGGLVLKNTLTIGTFVVLYQFSSQLMDAYYNIYQTSVDFSGKLSSVGRLRGLMAKQQFSEGQIAFDASIEEIVLEDVRFTYPQLDRPVLNGISMRIRKGQKIAIVGMSGSGKSTLVQLLVRFYQPSSGRILLNGLPLEKLDMQSFAKRVAVLFQEPYLFPDTVRHNLQLGRAASEERLQAACQIAQIDDTVRQWPDGYETVLGERGITLSGGQRQRIALARALLLNPEVLILDEATSSLDPETERALQKALERELPNSTIVTIAHRLSTVQEADVIYVLDQGRIVESGRHEELQQRGGLYRKLLDSQLRHEQHASSAGGEKFA